MTKVETVVAEYVEFMYFDNVETAIFLNKRKNGESRISSLIVI